MGWNIFRILGDVSHLLSKVILIYAIHRNRSAEGVSWITQVLYAVVFCSRYTDIFSESSRWNFFFKLFYILSSIYIIAIMRWLFPRTREREIAWKLGAATLAGSLLLSPFAMLIFEGRTQWSFFTWIWDFSQILESICVLPQLLLLRQTSVPTVIDSFYLISLGAYRALYCLNWIWRELDPNDRKPNAVSVIFGIIQTALYFDFFWVYYTRQRVKLRYGGIVDADDIRRGWLLNRIFGNKHFENNQEDEESVPALGDGENGNALSQRRSKWGARGISISADDTTFEQEHDDDLNDEISGTVDPDAKMKDPDELARALDDDEDDDDDDDSDEDEDEDEDDGAPSGSNTNSTKNVPPGVNNENEWRST